MSEDNLQIQKDFQVNQKTKVCYIEYFVLISTNLSTLLYFCVWLIILGQIFVLFSITLNYYIPIQEYSYTQ